MNPQQSTAKIGRKWIIVPAVIALAIGFYAVVTVFLGRYRAPPVQASLVSISFVGRSTNDAGQQCVAYRLQNDNAEKILALAEFQNSTPGSELFVRLPKSQPQTIVLSASSGSNPYRIQISCFVEDRGLLSRAYNFVQHFRGGQPPEITKLLFTVSGPLVEP